VGVNIASNLFSDITHLPRALQPPYHPSLSPNSFAVSGNSYMCVLLLTAGRKLSK